MENTTTFDCSATRRRHSFLPARSGRRVNYGVRLCFKLAKQSLAFGMPLLQSVRWISRTGQPGVANQNWQVLDAKLLIMNIIGKYSTFGDYTS